MKSHPEIKTEYLIKLYKGGCSLPEISEMVGITNQAVWERLKRSGIKLRSPKESVELAYKRGRLIVPTGKNHHSWKGGRNKNKSGYIVIVVRQKRYFEHRIVWEDAHGKIPAGHIIHHLNGIRDDNRLENLCLLPRERHSPSTIIEPHQIRIRELEEQLTKIIWQKKK